MQDSEANMMQPNNLRPLKRFITTHEPSGKATLCTAIPEQAQEWQQLPKAAMFLAYSTDQFPVRLSDDSDVQKYGKRFSKPPPGLTLAGGTICRVVDIAPGDVSPMHRTQSVDYGVVIEGEIELIMEDLTRPTEKRIMGRGDICVQRGTMHAWRNTSATHWARMLFVLLDCEKPVIDGQAFGEELNHMEGMMHYSTMSTGVAEGR